MYSAWAPQFAERLRLSSTESNLIVRPSQQGRWTVRADRFLGCIWESGHVRYWNTCWTLDRLQGTSAGSSHRDSGVGVWLFPYLQGFVVYHLFASGSSDERSSTQQWSRFHGCPTHLFLLVLDGVGQLLCVLCSNQNLYAPNARTT